MAVSPRCLKQFIIAREYTKVWPATLRKIFGESCQVLMLVLKCLKALGTMLFARFAWIVFRRKIFLILTVLCPWYKPQFEYQICIFRFSTLFFIHSLWYCLREFYSHIQHSSLVIISVILMTCLFDQPMLMLGEIGSVSLLGLKELKETETTAVQARYWSKCSAF